LEKEEIFDLIRTNPFFFLATLDSNQPRVRGMLAFRADTEGIVFHTLKTKDLHKQLIANPAVEACFYRPADICQVRVSGFVDLVEDRGLKDEMVDRYPFLGKVVRGNDLDSLAVYRLSNGSAVIWTRGQDGEEKQPLFLG